MIGRVSRSGLLGISFLLLLFYQLQAQPTVKTTPLHTFFQNNYDSTIIYQSGSNWNNSPNYLILAKYQNRLDFFTYCSPYRDVLGHYFPGKLVQKFSQEEARFRATTPDTNRYLLPTRALASTLSKGWRLLNPRQFWLVKDDQAIMKTADRCMIEDGDENIFYFIDKKTIRAASFYAPAYWEECLGQDLGRQQAIRAINTLRAVVKPE